MSDLVDFLRAQWDDDTAFYANRAYYNDGSEECEEAKWRLADIESKRRMLEWLDHYEDRRLDVNGWSLPEADGALMLITLPYSDRPGWREEWRPTPA